MTYITYLFDSFKGKQFFSFLSARASQALFNWWDVLNYWQIQ